MSIFQAVTYGILFILTFCSNLQAQIDSLSLSLDKLGISDIHITTEQVAAQKILTTSSLFSSVDELPYSLYVITSEEILNKGLFSLGDVLKLVPGIHVSQPGSTVHGETFIVNGLFGNTHAKIMIDNLAVKSLNMSGTPIGEQLPIRQAERIEIIYGPSTLQNGPDAGAMTINIVTRKSERPIFVHANLAGGSGRYNNMNVQFGGKLGKKKNTLRFIAYGSNSNLNNTNIAMPFGPYFDPLTYTSNSFYVLSDSLQLFSNLPQSSRQIGLSLQFKGFSYSISQMQRSTHSAIGGNPLAYNYNNSNSSYGERMIVSNLAYKKDFKKFRLHIPTKLFLLDVEDESFFDYNFPFAKQQLDRITDEQSNGDSVLRDSIIGINNNRYFDGRRFASGSITQFRLYPSVSFFTKNVEFQLKSSLDLLLQSPFEVYNSSPDQINGGGAIQVNANLIGNAFVKLGKLNLILGLNYLTSSGNSLTDDNGTNFSKVLPHFAALYKFDKNLTLRANYSNSYMIQAEYWASRGASIVKGTSVPSLEANTTFEQNPQETRYGELGVRWKLKDLFDLDVAIFKSRNTNLLTFQTVETEDEFLFGYNNSNNASANLTGIRASISSKNLIEKINLRLRANFSYLQGSQDLPNGEFINDILGQPKSISQISISLNPVKKLFLSVDNFFIGKYTSSSILSLSEYESNLNSNLLRRATWSMNIAASLYLTDNFNVFLKVNNYNSNFIPGINATGSPDDLSLNTQRNAYFITGVNYTLD